MMHIPPRLGDEERARWVVEEDRVKKELRVYPQPVHMLVQVRGGPEVVALSRYLEGRVGQQVNFPHVVRPGTLPKKAASQAAPGNHGSIASDGGNHEVIQHGGMELPEEYMRRHCGKELDRTSTSCNMSSIRR